MIIWKKIKIYILCLLFLPYARRNGWVINEKWYLKFSLLGFLSGNNRINKLPNIRVCQTESFFYESKANAYSLNEYNFFSMLSCQRKILCPARWVSAKFVQPSINLRKKIHEKKRVQSVVISIYCDCLFCQFYISVTNAGMKRI